MCQNVISKTIFRINSVMLAKNEARALLVTVIANPVTTNLIISKDYGRAFFLKKRNVLFFY